MIELPFGSYSQSQGKTYVDVTAHLSDYADVDQPLTLFARGGFQLGVNNNGSGAGTPPPREGNFFAHADTTPKPFTIDKTCVMLSIPRPLP